MSHMLLHKAAKVYCRVWQSFMIVSDISATFLSVYHKRLL